LLARLGLEFQCAAPDSDETPLPGEPPQELVVRLAGLKVAAVVQGHPDALIIGSDQVATLDGEILGKPDSHARTAQQRASGRRVTFHTGLCLLNGRTRETQCCCEPFHVHFRALSRAAIDDYLRREQPYNCAGSFKSVGLGICLFRRLEGDGPNALIGQPLIRLADMLANAGVEVLQECH